MASRVVRNRRVSETAPESVKHGPTKLPYGQWRDHEIRSLPTAVLEGLQSQLRKCWVRTAVVLALDGRRQ